MRNALFDSPKATKSPRSGCNLAKMQCSTWMATRISLSGHPTWHFLARFVCISASPSNICNGFEGRNSGWIRRHGCEISTQSSWTHRSPVNYDTTCRGSTHAHWIWIRRHPTNFLQSPPNVSERAAARAQRCKHLTNPSGAVVSNRWRPNKNQSKRARVSYQ